MLTESGPKLIEYNVRFGDPECQCLMLRMKSDLLAALVAAMDGELSAFDLRWHDRAVVAVTMAAEGYPANPRKHTIIRGLEAAAAEPGAHVFHAGTEMLDGNLVANGGRVLTICAAAPTIAAARDAAYRAVDKVDWPEGFCRRDIAWRALARVGV